VHHRVDRVLELLDLAAHLHGDLLGEVAVRDRRRHLGDVAHLRGQVRGHRVHRVGEVLPRAGHALHVGLAAELPFRADLARHARDFRGERGQLRDHRVHGLLGAEELALERPAVELDRHRPGQVALRHRADDAGDLVRRLDQVGDQRVHRVGDRGPGAAAVRDLRARAELPFLPDDRGDPLDLVGEPLVELDDLVQRVGDLPRGPGELHRHAHAEVALFHGGEGPEQQPVEILRRQLRSLVNTDPSGHEQSLPLEFKKAVRSRGARCEFDAAGSAVKLGAMSGDRAQGTGDRWWFSRRPTPVPRPLSPVPSRKWIAIGALWLWIAILFVTHWGARSPYSYGWAIFRGHSARLLGTVVNPDALVVQPVTAYFYEARTPENWGNSPNFRLPFHSFLVATIASFTRSTLASNSLANVGALMLLCVVALNAALRRGLRLLPATIALATMAALPF